MITIGTGVIDPPAGIGTNAFAVYPNPASQRAYLLFDGAIERDADIVIYNNLGSVVRSTRIDRGEDRMELPVNGLPAGIYMIRAVSGNEILGVRKLTISR